MEDNLFHVRKITDAEESVRELKKLIKDLSEDKAYIIIRDFINMHKLIYITENAKMRQLSCEISKMADELGIDGHVIRKCHEISEEEREKNIKKEAEMLAKKERKRRAIELLKDGGTDDEL